MLLRDLKIYLPSYADCDLVTPDETILENFVLHNINTERAALVSSPSEADIIIIFEKFSFKLPSYREHLLKQKLITEFASKVYVINYDDVVGVGYLPGCYVSMSGKYDESKYRPCPYPKTYNDLCDDGFNNTAAKYLFSFRGNSPSHPIRKRIFELLQNSSNAKLVDVSKEFHSHTINDKKDYISDIKSSLFVLCPRGCSPNSYRLYETMSLGRCPVVISDDWVENIGPDWSKCSVRVPEDKISDIPEILSKLKPNAEKMGIEARKQWQLYFSEEKKYQFYLDQIFELYNLNSLSPVTIDQLSKYWKSHSFLYANNWSLRQKITRKFKQLLCKS